MNLLRGNTTCVYLIAIIAIQFSSYTLAEVASCIQCDGVTTKCSDNLSEEPKPCATSEESCFTQIDSKGIISRGCLAADNTECTTANNCIKTDSGKNNQIICKTCDGTDAKCSQTDMNDNDVKYNKICDETAKNCITKVDNKKVVRACATDDDVTKCTDENTCKTCNTNNCNVGIFPTKRIQCYQCTDSNCVDVSANSLVSTPCLNYVDKDECYTKGESETKMIRGCKSDDTDNQCSSTIDGCLFCSTDNCNNFKYKRDQALKCYQCSGSATETACFNEQTDKDFKNCAQQILYNDAEYCYTHVDGGKIQRGCLHDNNDLTIDKCKDGDEASDCNKCNADNGCNSKAVSTDFTCLICRSDLEKKCWNNADTLQGSECRVRPSSAEEGCFHGIWNGVAIRGCVIDASEQVQETCKENKQCRICNEKNCNNKKSSGAGKISLYFGLWFTIFTTLWIFN